MCQSRIVHFFAFFLFAVTNAKAQSIAVSKADTAKIIEYNLKCYELERTDIKKALEYADKSLELAEALGEKRFVAAIYFIKGNIYTTRGVYFRAFENYWKAAKISEEIGDRKKYASCLVGLGNVYWYQGDLTGNVPDYKKALGFYLKSLSMRKQIKDSSGLVISLNNIGSVNFELGVLTKDTSYFVNALVYYESSLRISSKLGEKEGIAYSKGSLGQTYLELRRFDEALNYNLESFEINKELNDEYGQAESCMGLGEVYLERAKLFYGKDNLDKAEFYFHLGLSFARKVNVMDLIKDSYNGLAEVYFLKKDYKNAYESLREEIALKDSLVNEANSKRLSTLSARYETEIKDNEIAELNEKEKLQAFQLAKQQNLLLTLGIGVAIIFAFLIIIYRNYRNKNKLYRKLSSTLTELNETNIQLEHSRRVKEQFLSNMSHEIRTPMNAVMGLSHLLVKSQLSPAQSRYVNAIKTSSENLLVLLNDILDISKLEAGMVLFENKDFNLSRVLQNTLLTFEAKFIEKKLKSFIIIDPLIAGVINGDPARLAQILNNLISNAIKFTSEGSVTVSVNPRGSRLRFSVKDSGIGIAPDRLGEAFEQFTQLHKNNVGGTGLGLSICKQIVERQGGEIEIQSKEGQGTEVLFTIPYFPVANSEPELQNFHVDLRNIGAKRILLADDNIFNQMVAVDLLKDWNEKLEIDVVSNGKEVIMQLEKERYDAILLDVQMPEMDGFEAARIIRNDYPTLPLLAITAYAIPEETRRCLEAGMNDFICKPIVPLEFYTKVSALFA